MLLNVHEMRSSKTWQYLDIYGGSSHFYCFFFEGSNHFLFFLFVLTINLNWGRESSGYQIQNFLIIEKSIQMISIVLNVSEVTIICIFFIFVFEGKVVIGLNKLDQIYNILYPNLIYYCFKM